MMIGWEAQLWLQHCLESGVLEDPAVDYLAERVDEMDDDGERIRVTKDYRILLPDRFDTEIRLRPLVKTVFLLFLRHPEGIRFGDLPAYRNELMDLYLGITRRPSGPETEASIDRLIDPRDNSIHEKAANLARQLHPREGGEPGSGPLEILSAGKDARLHADGQGRRSETHPAGPEPGRMGITQNTI